MTLGPLSENPYQSPGEAAATNLRQTDPLRLPAIGCFGSAFIAIAFAGYLLWFSQGFLRVAHEAENEKAIEAAHEMATGSYRLMGLSVLAVVAAVCMLLRRWRWFVLITSVLGIITCIPAPLAAIIFMRVRRKDIWNSFR